MSSSSPPAITVPTAADRLFLNFIRYAVELTGETPGVKSDEKSVHGAMTGGK